MNNNLQRKIIYTLGFALLLYVGLVLWSDVGQLSAALTSFPWRWLPVAIGLTLLNYGGRLYKWQWYLALIGVNISRRDSARIFLVGMLMALTPGKAGEFLKSYMVRTVNGTPISLTAPIVLAERITDGIAMLLLAGVGLFAFPEPAMRWLAAIIFVGFLLGVTVIQIRPLALWLLAWGGRLPLVRRFASGLAIFYESSYILFQPRNLIISLAIGVISWFAEALAYYVILLGFGVTPGWDALLRALFIFCISTVIGAVVATPGGLGGMEGSLVALSTRLLGFAVPTATAAALIVRFCTLWLGIGIGVVSFLLWSNLLTGAGNPTAEKQ
jgi:glycosyltransferase 2 family protein